MEKRKNAALTFNEISDLLFDLMTDLNQRYLPKHREVKASCGSTALYTIRRMGGMGMFKEYYNLKSKEEWCVYQMTGKFEI